MGNHTVNKKTGKPAGINESIRITGGEMMRQGKEYQIGETTIDIKGFEKGEAISIRAYNGGNPNRSRIEQEEMIH